MNRSDCPYPYIRCRFDYNCDKYANPLSCPEYKKAKAAQRDEIANREKQRKL